MNTLDAFIMGELHRNDEMMVFDWDEAARLIKKSGCEIASAGLQGDWEYTGGTIFKDGKPYMDDYTFLASTWATPLLVINGKKIDCYKMESKAPGWNAETKWPESALKILKGEQ